MTMIRKLSIEVKTVKEFEAIKIAINDPKIRAFLGVCGILKSLDDETRIKVMQCMQILQN